MFVYRSVIPAKSREKKTQTLLKTIGPFWNPKAVGHFLMDRDGDVQPCLLISSNMITLVS